MIQKQGVLWDSACCSGARKHVEHGSCFVRQTHQLIATTSSILDSACGTDEGGTQPGTHPIEQDLASLEAAQTLVRLLNRRAFSRICTGGTIQ